MWTVLQRAEDIGEVIAVSDADMAALDGENFTVDQIVRAAPVVLRVLVGPLITQRELGTCCYLLVCLLGTRGPLFRALRYLIVTINKNFSSLSVIWIRYIGARRLYLTSPASSMHT